MEKKKNSSPRRESPKNGRGNDKRDRAPRNDYRNDYKKDYKKEVDSFDDNCDYCDKESCVVKNNLGSVIQIKDTEMFMIQKSMK